MILDVSFKSPTETKLPFHFTMLVEYRYSRVKIHVKTCKSPYIWQPNTPYCWMESLGATRDANWIALSQDNEARVKFLEKRIT